MLTTNIDIADRLINGQIGTVDHIVSGNGVVIKIYVQFSDEHAGLSHVANDPYGRLHGNFFSSLTIYNFDPFFLHFKRHTFFNH